MKFSLPKTSTTNIEQIFKKCTQEDSKKCPFCKNDILYSIEKGKRYKCKECKKKFRDWTNTYLENHRLKKKDVYNVVWCFINGLTGYECSNTTSLPYQTVFNLYSSIRYALPELKIPQKQLKLYKEFEHLYLSKFKGVSKKNLKNYKKEIKWQFKNKNRTDKAKMIICNLLSPSK